MCKEILAEAVPKRWGALATAAFSLAVFILFLAIQIFVVIGFVVFEIGRNPQSNMAEYADTLVDNGLLLSIAGIASTIPCVAAIILLTWFRKGISVREYLRLRLVSLPALGLWIGAMLAYGILYDATALLLGKPVVPEFVSNAYATAVFVPLLWLAFVVAAPLFEEFFFRGFLFEGILNSRLGAVGATLITSVCWAGIHIQYGLFEVVWIFGMGGLLCYARLKTGSLVTPIAMHAVVNLIATVQAAWR